MKKMLLLVFTALCLCSCYNTRMIVGNVNPKDVKVVEKQWNNHLIGGLIPLQSTKVYPQKSLTGHSNYMIKTNMNFWNCLIAGVTMGIYTPTQTVYYLPNNE